MDAIKEGMLASAKAAEAAARIGERLFCQNALNIMKFNSQICTSREQSERLLGLGLKKETADMFYDYCKDRIGYTWYLVPKPATLGDKRSIPAWSLHRLIEMMPFDVIPEGGFDNCFTLIKNYPKGYSVEYDGFSYYYKENIYDTLINAIEHLIKEGYFNDEYLV